jgi:hypothetical protein
MDKKLTLTATLAAALTGLAGCSSGPREVLAEDNTRICVDEFGSRIDDDYCDDDDGYRRSGGGLATFLYLRKGSPIPYYYDNVRDKKYANYLSRTPLPGYVRAPASSNMSRSSAVSRGGLGSSGSRFGRGG